MKGLAHKSQIIPKVKFVSCLPYSTTPNCWSLICVWGLQMNDNMYFPIHSFLKPLKKSLCLKASYVTHYDQVLWPSFINFCKLLSSPKLKPFFAWNSNYSSALVSHLSSFNLISLTHMWLVYYKADLITLSTTLVIILIAFKIKQ